MQMGSLVNEFKVVPRVNKKDKKIELYYIDEYLDVMGWCQSEGHFLMKDKEYYLSETKSVPDSRWDEAKTEFEKYLDLYPKQEWVSDVLRKKLTPPTYKLVAQTDSDKAYYNQFKTN